MKKINTDIVLIDSGVNNHKVFDGTKVDGVFLKRDDDEYIIDNDLSDSCGHGTAIYYILKRECPKARVFVIKLFEEDLSVELEDIIFALQYIKRNINCKIIHMSLGVSFCDDIDLFERNCNYFYDKGIAIVSAFDNLGTLSYPAAFENVIGVDIVTKGLPIKGYQYVEGSPVNVRFLGRNQYLPCLNNSFKNMIGSSFFAPYISCLIYNSYDTFEKNGLESVHYYLRENSVSYLDLTKNNSLEVEHPFEIKRAVIFPFNKEIHSIAGNQDLCNFEVLGYYDIKYLGNIHKKVSDILTYTTNNKEIQNIEKLDWSSSFDTFILGHVDELSNFVDKNYIEFVVDKCIEYNKQLYCFDDIDKYISDEQTEKLTYFSPSVTLNNVFNNTFGKMHCISKPILNIMGTSSKQGKYALQLQLRRKFIDNGYNVGQFGTEPTGYLFGFNEVYPYGYNSTVQISGNNSIYTINRLLGNIEKQNVDIILVGSQSQTVHYNTGNIGCYAIQNTELLLGTEPDGVVLVVNYDDPYDYIIRTIKYIESIQDTIVIALVLYPINRDTRLSVLGKYTSDYDEKEVIDFQRDVEIKTGKKCFLIDDTWKIDNLFDLIVDFFTE